MTNTHTNPIPITFNASSVQELIRAATAFHSDAELAGKKAMQLYKLAGERLIAAKAKVPHGEWESTLERTWPNSARHARRCMRIFREWDRASAATSFAEAAKLISEEPDEEQNGHGVSDLEPD